MTEPTPEVLLLAAVERTHYSTMDLLTLTATFCYVDPSTGNLLNPSHDSWRCQGIGHFDALAITAQLNLDDETPSWYGYRLEYRQPYSVDLAWAEMMVATLKKVQRHLDRLDAKYGHATDLAAYIGRVGAALKVSTFGWAVKNGTLHSDSEYRWGDVDALRYRLDDEVRAAKPKVQA